MGRSVQYRFLMGRIQKLCNILSNTVMYIVKGGFTWQEMKNQINKRKVGLLYDGG